MCDSSQPSWLQRKRRNKKHWKKLKYSRSTSRSPVSYLALSKLFLCQIVSAFSDQELSQLNIWRWCDNHYLYSCWAKKFISYEISPNHPKTLWWMPMWKLDDLTDWYPSISQCAIIFMNTSAIESISLKREWFTIQCATTINAIDHEWYCTECANAKSSAISSYDKTHILCIYSSIGVMSFSFDS